MSLVDTRPTPPDAQAIDLSDPRDVQKQLPSNIEAEQALLGAILYDNTAYDRADGIVVAADFYEPFHGRMFSAIELCIQGGKLAEPIVLMDRFRTDPAFEQLGGLRYLADLVDRAPPAVNAPDYARSIRDLSIRRQIAHIAWEALDRAINDTETAGRDQIEEVEQGLYALAESGRTPTGARPLADCLADAVKSAAEAYERDGKLGGLSTGLVDLDRRLGGLYPSDLIILAGRPSMGKSALACNIAFHIARRYAFEELPEGGRRTTNGGVVMFFSLEMSGEQLAMRILAEVSGVPSDRIRKGEIEAYEFGRIRDAAIEIQQSPLHIDDTGGLSMAKLAARARRLKRTQGLALIIVDYLQLVTGDRSNRNDGRVQEVSQVTQQLKALAKELNVPVMALSQLSRKVEDRPDKKPMLSDLRESGSIEQDADVVAFVYREAYYHEREEPQEGTPEHLAWQEKLDACLHQADVIIGKQRHGPIGTVKLAFNDSLTKFSNLAREAKYDGPPNRRLEFGAPSDG